MKSSDGSFTVPLKWRDVLVFTALAYLLSWLWWGFLFLSGTQILSNLSQMSADGAQATQLMVALGNFGPLLSALVMRLFVSKEGLKGSMGWRRSWKLYLGALLAPIAFFALVALANHAAGLGRFGWTRNEMPLAAYLGGELLIGTLIVSVFVFGEEYGWRGYLLPRLLSLGEVRGTALVGLIWAFWHLPLLLAGLNYPGQSLWLALPLFTLVVVALSFPFTWFYKAAAGSVVLCSLLHGSINAYGDGLTAPEVVPTGNPLVTGSAGLVTLAALLVMIALVYGARRERKRLRWHTPLMLLVIVALLAPLPFPASAGSGGPFTEGVSVQTSAHASAQYVLPGPGDVGVNTWNGNLVLPRTDLYLPARGIPLELLMVYNSQRRDDGLNTYGPGWRMGYHVAYALDPYNGNFVVTWGDGNTSVLPVVGDHLHAPSGAPELVAARYAPGKYRVRLADGATYTFDNATHRRVTRIEDAAGNALAFTYDGGGNLTRVANTAGGHFDFTYTAGRLTAVTDSAGRSVQYQYDAQGDQIRFVDVMGVVTNYLYAGAEHLLIGLPDLGVDIGYGAPPDLPTARRVTLLQTAQLRREFEYVRDTYQYPWNRTTVTDTAGLESRVTVYRYDELGRLGRTVDAQGNVQNYTWDSANNLSRFTDANGRAVDYSYDSRGNLLTMADALGNVTRYTWHPLFNNLSSITDPLGRTTRYNYDARGNLIGIVDAQGNQTQFEYDAYGQMFKLIDARGHATVFEYDAAGNRVRFTNALGQSGGYHYDAAGNLTAVVGPDGAQTVMAYNAAGEMLHAIDPLGHTRLVTYTQTGLVAAVADESGRTTTYGYDARGRVSTVTDALGGVRAYTYDGFGYLSGVTDPNGHSATFGYDAAGRAITETDPLGQVVTYAYDAAGNVLSRTDSGGATLFAYDALGQHVATTYPDGSRVDLGYDAVGNVITATGPGFTYTYAYDENRHLIGVQDLALGTAISYTYDPNGNRRSMTDPDGGLTYYFYDALDRLERLVNPLGETTTWTYDARGRVARVTYPNATWADLDYDALGRVTELVHRQAGGAIVARYNYTYDAVGNRLSVTEDGDGDGYGTTSYTYDALNRLVRADGPDGTLAYAYDAVGNRLVMTDTAGVTTYTYDAADRLLQSVAPGGLGTDYTYDQRGNLIGRTAGPDTTTYTYDGANRLVQVQLPGGEIQHFTYDQSGLRRSRSDASGTIDYVYDPLTQNLLLERQDSVTVARYTHGLELDGPISQRRAGSSTFYHLDALGSVAALSDPSQNVVARYRYDPFGQPTFSSGSAVNPLRFAGRPWDAESGLYDLRQRVYDPALGRFLTPDPLRVPTLPDLHAHPYAYAANNPASRVDPEGLAWNPWAWIETGINMVAAGFDAWRNGGSLTDIVQAVGVSGAVDAANALLGGIVPNTLRDPVKNLIGQLIDWMRGKRCGINWGEFVRSIGIGLIKDIAGKLYKAGAIGKDTYSKIIEQVHGGIQGVWADAAGPQAVPVAGSGPCHKRRQQPPVRQEVPRRQPPRRPTGPPAASQPVGVQQGRHGGGSTGTAQVTQLTPNPIRSGSGQPLTHRYELHNTSAEPRMLHVFIAYHQQIANPTWSASVVPERANVHQWAHGTYLELSFTGAPSNTVTFTTTGTISPTQPLSTGQVLQPRIEVYVGDEKRTLDSPTEVGDGSGGPAPALRLNQSDWPDPVAAGGIQTYTLRVENTGGVDLSNVVITETYPAGVSYRAATPAPSVGNYRWNLGELAVREIKTVTVTVQVAAGLAHNTLLSNVVRAASDQTPQQAVTETATLRNQPILLVSKTADPWPPQPGGPVTFTLGYANQGGAALAGLTAVEALDPRLSFVSASPAPASGHPHVWSLGSLAAGGSGQIVVVMQVPATLPYGGDLHNEVVFFADQVEPVVTAVGYTAIVGPDQGGAIVYSDSQGLPTRVQVPAGAVTTTTTLVYTPLDAPGHALPPGLHFAGHAFRLEAWRGGALLGNFAFQQPVTVTLRYSEADVAELFEDSLTLAYWDGSAAQWRDARTTCTPPSAYDRYPGANQLALPLCHLSDFALLGRQEQHVYLPLVRR